MVYGINPPSKTYMKQFIYTFQAESLKLKYSGIPRTAYILALIMPLIGIGMSIFSFFETEAPPTAPVYPFYQIYDQLIKGFIYVFYPIIIIVTASRIAQLEHRNNTWQLMETQPIKRTYLFTAKFLKAYQICFYSILFFFAGFLLNLGIDYILKPGNEFFIVKIHWFFLVQQIVKITLCTGLLLALIYAFSVRFSNTFLSVIVGIGALLSAPILSALNLLPKWHPTFLLGKIVDNPSDLGKWLTFNEYLSIVGMFVILWITNFWYIYKNKKWYVTNRSKVVFRQVFPILILGLTFVWILQPNKMLPGNQTVIKGNIPENMDIKEIYLLDGMINDTLQIIKVTNKAFHHPIKEKIPLKTYRLAWTDHTGNHQERVLFSENDIVEVQFRDASKNQSFKILGTRLAENNLAFSLSENYRLSEYYVNRSNPSDAKYFMKILKDDYKKDQRIIRSFHTADNYIIRNDYAEIVKKENAFKYALLWDQYKERVLRSSSDFEYKDQTIEDILDIELNTDDEHLARAERPNYYRYMIHTFVQNDTLDDNRDSKLFRAISSMTSSELRSQFAKVILNEESPKASKEELGFYEVNYLPMIQTKRTKAYFTKMLQDLRNLSIGNQAFSFKAITPENELRTLNDYEGKYVILDFWASWCAPCLAQAVDFEKHAMEYNKRSDVVFISLSIDERENDWRKKVKLNDKHVIQLYAKNIQELNQFYRIESIPRFLVIDPEGKILNSSFPFPSEGNFKQLLDKLLPEQ